jgi:hypothetical protein
MMTDAEIRQQVERTDHFIADFREMVAATAVPVILPAPAQMLTVADFSGSLTRWTRCRS